jgi:hypothetical protein
MFANTFFVHREAAPIDVKTGSSDPADFPTTRIPVIILFVAYCGTSLRAANVCVLIFTQTATTLWHHIFQRTITPQTRQFALIWDRVSTGPSKMVPDLPQMKTNFNFYDDILQNYMYDGPKCMSGIFLLRPGSLKELWQLAINWTPSCSTIRQIWELGFYNYECANLSLGLN